MPKFFGGGGVKLTFKQKFKPGAPIPFDNVYFENEACYLSICAIFKNEASYLKEWIDYHLLAGVERFYLYDNDSTDNPLNILQPYINEGIVIYHKIKGTDKQFTVYKDAIYKYKNQTRWMAIIDLDEFIVPVKKDNIKELLKNYEKYPAIGINELHFDSNGHETKPKGGVIENYTRVAVDCNLQNIHYKSIVNPKEVVGNYSAHYCVYKKHKLAVSPSLKPIPENTPFSTPVLFDIIQINHYRTKSKEEFLARLKKGHPINGGAERILKGGEINFYGKTSHDYAIQKFLPELKKKGI